MFAPAAGWWSASCARYSLWAARRRLKGWRGSASWRSAHFTTAGELRRLFEQGGAASVTTRYGLYLPPWDTRLLVARAPTVERLGCRLGAMRRRFRRRAGRPTLIPVGII